MARVLESKLILSLVDRVTAPARNVQAQMDRLNGRIKAANEQASKVGGQLTVAAAQMAGFAYAVAQPVRAAMDLESAMADVRKVVDFPTPAAFQQFQEELVDMSTQLPIAVTGLAEIAAAAGQAGIAGKDLTRFTREAAQIGVAFDISAGEAGDAMAKMMTGLDLSIDQVVSLSDAMNHLSNAQASSAAEILDVVRRAGAQGRQFGFSAEETAAFASAMISAGAQSDVAATSFMNMGRALTRGASATKRQNAAYAKLGLEATDVAKRMQENAVGTTIEVMEQIAKLPKDMRAAISSDLFGDEARALGPLLTNLNLVHESVGMVADQPTYAGSSLAEFKNRMKTFGATVQTFRNRLNALSIALGETLFPILSQIMEKITPFVEATRDWIRVNGELTAKIISVTGALIGMRVALLALRFAGLTGKSGALSMLALGMNTVGRAGIAMGGAVRESIRLQAALAAMDGAKIGFFTRLGAALRGLAAVTGLRAVGTAIGAVAGAVGAISAPAWAAIAAAVAAVGLAWKYWDRISSIVLGVADAIGTALRPAIEGLRAWMEPAAPLLNALGNAFGFVWNKVKGLVDYVKRLAGGMFTREILTDGEQAELRSRAAQVTADIIAYFIALPGKLLTIGGEMIQNLWDGMKAKWDEFKGWLSSIPDQISGAMSGAVLSPNASAATSMAQGIMDAPGLAVGGRMSASVPTLVGERGPEMVYPSRSGWVAHANKVKNLSRLASQAAGASAAAAHSADMARRARLAPAQTITQIAKTPVPRPSSVTRPQALPDQPARQSVSGPISVTFGNIVVQGGANASARDISREIGRTVQAELRGTFTDPY